MKNRYAHCQNPYLYTLYNYVIICNMYLVFVFLCITLAVKLATAKKFFKILHPKTVCIYHLKRSGRIIHFIVPHFSLLLVSQSKKNSKVVQFGFEDFQNHLCINCTSTSEIPEN